MTRSPVFIVLSALVSAVTLPACGHPTELRSDTGACQVTSFQKLSTPVNLFISPDGKKYAANRQDANGVYQVYVGDFDGTFSGAADAFAGTCISCDKATLGIAPDAQKLLVVWHPSSQWLFVGVEIPHDVPFYESPEADLGLMQSGINMEMHVAKPDGSAWYRLTQLAGLSSAGYTGPAVTADGHAYYAQIVDGNIFAYSEGRWRLMEGEFSVDAQGIPTLQNPHDVTPDGTNWVEPGNLTVDDSTLLLTTDTGLVPTQASGMDQWTLNLKTGAYTNLTHSKDEWDEHGTFSPSGKKIVFMSSHPYPDYQASVTGVFGLKTEFMLMNADGSDLVQLTHFNETGYPESTPDQVSVAAVAFFTPDGTKLVGAQLLTGQSFPNQVSWVITFAGKCGG